MASASGLIQGKPVNYAGSSQPNQEQRYGVYGGQQSTKPEPYHYGQAAPPPLPPLQPQYYGGQPAQAQPYYGHQQQHQSLQYGNSSSNGYDGNDGNGPNNTVSTVATTGLLTQQGNPVKCHKVDYEIKGNDCQLVEIQLDPSETVIAEAGAMMYLDDNIDFKVKFGDGSNPSQGFFSKLMSAGGRILTGESLFLTHFTNRGSIPARVAFAAPYPGTILAIDMQLLNNQTLICERDAFLAAAMGTKVSVHFHKKFGAGLFGGEGFILQKLKGDGMAFIHAGGTIIKRELRGERVRVDTGCLVAFTDGISYEITRVPGLMSMVFGGEGIFLASLQGTGTVWLQSLPFSRMCDRILANARSQGGTVGEGSMLTGQYGNYIDGDGAGGGLGGLGSLVSALGRM
jgi:uncharacterized protein (TIGR00266 family)